MTLHTLTAVQLTGKIHKGEVTATEAVIDALGRIESLNPTVNAFTTIIADRALARAAEIDAMLARGEEAGPLAGVPFAAKNIFDVAGVKTIAGS